MSKILIDNEKFNNIKEAARFLEVDYLTLVKKLKEYTSFKLKGFRIERLGKSYTKLLRKIVCKETGEVYNTLSELTKVLNLKNSATISIALNKDGVYINKGKHYYRTNEACDIVRHRTKHTKRKALQIEAPNQASQEKIESVQIQTSINADPKEILANLAKDMLTKKDYANAKVLLDIVVNKL